MSKTAMITTATVIVLAIWDLIAVTYLGGVDVSISRFIQNASLRAPFISFAIGFLCGHFFGFMPPVCPECPETEDEA